MRIVKDSEFRPAAIIEYDSLNEEQQAKVKELIPQTWGLESGRGTLFAPTIEVLGNSHRVALGSRNTASKNPVLLHSGKGYCVVAPQYLPFFRSGIALEKNTAGLTEGL